MWEITAARPPGLSMSSSTPATSTRWGMAQLAVVKVSVTEPFWFLTAPVADDDRLTAAVSPEATAAVIFTLWVGGVSSTSV